MNWRKGAIIVFFFSAGNKVVGGEMIKIKIQNYDVIGKSVMSGLM